MFHCLRDLTWKSSLPISDLITSSTLACALISLENKCSSDVGTLFGSVIKQFNTYFSFHSNGISSLSLYVTLRMRNKRANTDDFDIDWLKTLENVINNRVNCCTDGESREKGPNIGSIHYVRN